MIRPVAIVGIACRYPDASSPAELWENVLAGRRAFRRIPQERLSLDDYWSPDPAAPDRFYAQRAAVIDGFDFDRVKYKIAGSTYRTTDMTHWLALDTAALALDDAGFPCGDGLPGASTVVIVGNSLTGEFTRANVMRLRWPYVRRTLGAALKDLGWDDGKLADFVADLEVRYKSAFPAIDEDTLAGALSNTIAGRISNQFDFKGGCFTVDGACSSSLLSVVTACAALSDDLVDAAVVGGVDLSIDPFELIGFAKTGALATGEMRVYDRKSNGFWPGEGCGMLVLLRQEDAEARGLRIYATIAGWGYSSDGKGGITRPDAAGHRLALSRAYRLAGFDIGTVSYLEGHGTGTAVGDATELKAFTEARRAAQADAPAAAIGSVKGNIGHTKAAAGMAGLIKATMAVHHQVIPPATSHSEPHPELTGDKPALRVPLTAEPWPAGRPVRAGVSSMGFGGINAHIVITASGDRPARPRELDSRTECLVSSRQDCELLLIDAASTAELRGRVAHLAGLCGRLAFAELGDVAGTLQGELAGWPVRAAVVAGSPDQASERLTRLLAALDSGVRRLIDVPGGVFLGDRATASDDQAAAPAGPRIGYLFPGQGSGQGQGDSAIAQRFETVRDLYRTVTLPVCGDPAATAVAQPRIAASSAAGLRVLSLLGIEAAAAVGHSLGELTALHWAGAMDEAALLDLASARGRVMADASEGGGAMAGIEAGPDQVEPLLSAEPVVIAGYNGPRQTVVSGPADSVDRVRAAAAARGLATVPIAVSHAFHSPAVAPAAAGLDAYLAGSRFRPLARRVLSTVTGHELSADADLRQLMVRQVREPVRFSEALGRMADGADLLIEVGPGRVLSGLAAAITPGIPVIPLVTDGTSLSGLLSAAAAAYVLGAAVRPGQLFAGRFTRPFPLDKEFRFLASPCESVPADSVGSLPAGDPRPTPEPAGEMAGHNASSGEGNDDSLTILCRLAAERAELPLEAVTPASHPLDELHLSSITVGQLMTQAARELGLAAPVVTSGYATSTLADLAQALDELASTALPGDLDTDRPPDGIAPWVRALSVELVAQSRGRRTAAEADGEWAVFASPGDQLAEAVGRALRASRLGDGVLLCLPARCGEEHVPLMLGAAQAALAGPGPCRFVAVQGARGAAGLAKTLHLEAPAIPVTVIAAPLEAGLPTGLAEQIAADVAATDTFNEVHYDEAGTRRVPVLRPVTALADGGELPIGRGDVLLVTGGGKGITAECALALARETGASVGLLGRSDPASDAGLAANLARMAAAGVTYRYVRADVTSAAEMRAAVADIGAALGQVTAVLHGAGRNEPAPLGGLGEDSFLRTLAPKIRGLETVLACVDRAALKLLVTFGSIIGRAGLRGQADYAVANDWLTGLTRAAQADNPGCRCLALEWSVWSGAGMGERLGVLESLTREGISPISVDGGVAILRQVLGGSGLPPALVIMGRAGGLPTITLEHRDLPLARFIDRPRVYYPGIELVADAELSPDSDPYLTDHLLDGELLFPAVLGIEAMAQAAGALVGSPCAPTLENVAFLRPIVVPVQGTATIRIAALRTGDSVDVAIRCGDTGFQADHFRARLRYTDDRPSDLEAERSVVPATGKRVPLDPTAELYGGIFFQGKRFQRVLGYRHLAATSCVAEILAGSGEAWFGPYLPAELMLGDPGARDAFMHAIQCCVPDATLLPVAVERLRPARPSDSATAADGREYVILSAAERHRDGDTYTYDVDVRAPDGELLERWEGLRLQAIRKTDGAGPWVPVLLGPYLERRLSGPDGLRCAVEPDGPDSAAPDARRSQTGTAVARMLGPAVPVWHRADGKPEVASEGISVSASHGAGVTLTVAGSGPVGCDAETVRDRPAGDWRELLGDAQFALAELIGCERGEPLSAAATRVWGAVECLRKTGRALAGPITLAGPATLAGPDAGGWVQLGSGQARIATFLTRVRDEPSPVVFSILMEGSDGSLLRVPPHRRFRGNQPGGKRLLRQLRALAGPVP
jgi:enediyne polyketide synthase